MFIGGLWFPELYLPDPEDPEWSWKEGKEVDCPAQSLYQLNEGKVFCDPFKHLQVNGVHPYQRWSSHENCVQWQVPPNPIRHVKRPTEKFIKFSVEHFPHSHFTTKERPDCVFYHPLYRGFRPLGDGSTSGLVDLTLNNPMFRPPDNQDWFIPLNESDVPQSETHDVSTPRSTAATIDSQFNPNDMLPYLSPTSLFADEEERVRTRAVSNWGEYDNGSSTRQELLQRWQEQESESNSNQNSMAGVAPTQKATTEVPSTGDQGLTTSGTYKIPKLPGRGILPNKVNEQAPKVSSPARAILPKPPGTVQNPRSLCNTSGSKLQKKKK